VQPICFPVLGSQTITFPDLSPEANFESLGAQARARTHPGWPLHSKCGVSVVKSQNRTVASPDPEAASRMSKYSHYQMLKDIKSESEFNLHSKPHCKDVYSILNPVNGFWRGQAVMSWL
jgi:hypothetical protein